MTSRRSGTIRKPSTPALRGAAWRRARPELIALDDERRAAIAELQKAQERRNAASKEIGQAMGRKDVAAAEALKAEVAALKTTMPELEASEKRGDRGAEASSAAIPNLPAADVPDGKDENDNVEIRRHRRAAGISRQLQAEGAFRDRRGARPDGFRGGGENVGRALRRAEGRAGAAGAGAGQFMLDLHTGEHGYTEVNPPLLVRDEAMFGTAQLPKFADDQFMARPRRAKSF